MDEVKEDIVSTDKEIDDLKKQIESKQKIVMEIDCVMK